jgi:hypothetical protein
MAKSWPKPGEKNFRQVDGNLASKLAESRKLVLIPDGMTQKDTSRMFLSLRSRILWQSGELRLASLRCGWVLAGWPLVAGS